MMRKKSATTYQSTGVDYSAMDPLKILAQKSAKKTGSNLSRFNMTEVTPSRGESAYVWEEKDSYRALVIEGLGTKNLVADAVGKYTKKSHYNTIAQDTVAAIINDLIVVGADPQVVNAYFAVGDSKWFLDKERAKDLVIGWARACKRAGAVWGGGETPTLKKIIHPTTIDLAGSAIGIIKPKKRLVLGNRIKADDAILLIESSGIHANGLTLARKIADRLPRGYKTKLSNKRTFGETLLTPTHIYAAVVRELFENNIDLHYMIHVTGHGWRKLMRAKQSFTYRISTVPNVSPLFAFIQQHSGNNDTEMYGNFNMGAGFAVYLPQNQVKKAQKIIQQHKLKSWEAGSVEKGPKQVIIEPKNITFTKNTLSVR